MYVTDQNGNIVGQYNMVPGQPPNGRHRRAEVPPPETEDPEARAAYIEYLKVLTDQEKMEVERMRIQNVEANIKAAHAEAGLFLNSLNEVRQALAQHSIDEENGGMGERTPVLPAFDELNRGRLQQRYLTLYDEFMRVRFKIDEKGTKLPIG